MKTKKQLWILAGGNGAGKSTFYRTRLATKGLAFINADIIARQLYPDAPESHSYDAARIAAEIRSQLLEQGRSFCFETVFSHPSKIDFVAEAKALGYEIILVFMHLGDSNLNQARVAQRVSEGGHDVPADKVINRIPRTLKNIRIALPLCDQVYVLDNATYSNPFKQIATLSNGMLEIHQKALPAWAVELLKEYWRQE